ncbi:phosphatases II [Gonapodya prolifera JEL478]|uniref:protein-tyrosine-phosphatase n=1 Tax=Gonapodya prolifera (strain JEL478) TaxID=1344416 RepID=A0A139A5Q8_GONPJ|nr:phosphatases II [Gonapodya prolifera JEL478]|eukprot:KXS12130.1 phosphatases II [Gonapodya prolifera JEL478]
MPTGGITGTFGSPRTVFNALQNENLVVDGRSFESYVSSHAVGAQSVWNEDWELPEDRNTAIVYGEAEGERKAAEALVKERFPGIPDVRHWIGPFKDFETAYPAAVVTGSEAGYADILPAHIDDHLWLGSALHAESPAVFQKLDISTVVCVMDDPGGARGKEYASRANWRDWPWVDKASFNLRGSLPDVIDAIDIGVLQARETGRGGVLVHCYQGKSRSAAAVVGWLIAKRGMSLQDAIQLVTDSRKAVAINEGFLRQLEQFELSVRKL